ncbi:putative transcriptional regulatory protein [Lachnellula suecica]|uniref:Putative transcriptional regulatory protein n=1 Tax=Lachnellula suecica TaxID=602035 RepID=A0A8T9CA95_9HELO|nr:putative transcriptional regulatory protein [Lachnellula suecica]
MTQIYTRPFLPSVLGQHSNYEKQQAPYFPHKVQDSDTCSSYSSRENETSSWSRSQPHSPMSDYSQGHHEVAPVNVGDLYQNRPEHSQKSTREQLPSLSSLFGSTPHQSRPAQSPYSDRHSPLFPPTTPRDGQHPATPVHPDRPFDGSYFHRPQHYSLSSRPEQAERLGLPSAPRPAASARRPESPRYESRFAPVEVPRNLALSSVNSWSPRSQSNHSEYFPRDTSSSFRTHSEHPPSAHRPEAEARPTYHEGLHSSPATPNFPPTPASTVVGELATVKDGLGPKIWTGTQFLPRFVRQAEVPGEGICYFYDDGTHCKTVIDGEVVNAHWGVTKAGKPRKRLAIACITCREKKIKCDPDYPRCVQCEKFGRICKFKNAPRGGQGSPDTPPADLEDIGSRPGSSSRTDPESFKIAKRENSESVSSRQVLRHATPDSETHHTKRQRTGYNDFTPVASEASPRLSVREAESPAIAWTEPLTTTTNDHNLFREWQVNPFTVRPETVSEIVDVLFKSGPETAASMFPQRAFKSWFLSANVKSLDDLMLIYSVLALGSIFSTKSEHKALGGQYASISQYACQNRRFSIQLVQSRLLLSLYYFAINNPNDAWDFCGASMRAASGLRLNVEIEKSEDAFLQTFPYGLNRDGYAECRRRTFWSCYLVDRFNGFCSGHFSVLHPEDVFLRLPCDANSFEAQAEVQNPFFDPATPPIQNVNWTVGSLAYLINVATIWGDVMANIYRSSQRQSPSPSKSFGSFYEQASQRLQLWHESLPSCYAFSPENLSRAADSGKISVFMTMHTVYRTTSMKLNRYIRQSSLTSAQLNHHVSLARQHAEALLRMSDTLAARRISTSTAPNEQSVTPARFSSPFVGYSIVSAIDILTARVPLGTVPTYLASFSGAQAVLAELALFWQSSKNQQALVLERVRDLAELTTGREGAGGLGFKFGNMGVASKDAGGDVFEMRQAIEKTFSKDFDCVYA